jgi:hypothetical protein
MFPRLIFYFIVIYFIYKGILFIGRLFNAFTKKAGNDSVPPKSKFKDVEEAHYTEIKEDKDKDSH